MLRVATALAWLLAVPTASFVLTPTRLGGVTSRPRPPLTMAALEDKGTDELDATIDALVRSEVEAAFATIDTQNLDPDDDEAIQMIEAKGREVMQSVLEKLEADGELLSSSLTSQIEKLSMTRQKQLLAEWDESTAKLQRQMFEERQTIRDEMARLTELNDEYKLAKSGGGGLGRDAIVGGISFIVGLTYVSAALNEVLKVATGGGNDASPATIAINAALGVAGVGYYFYRKGQTEA